MTDFLVAPSEPLGIKSLGRSSNRPEDFCADILWYQNGVGFIGCQRKSLTDLISSLHDDRWGIAQIKSQPLAVKVLIVEGRPNWTADGVLVTDHARWTYTQHRSFLWSAQSAGWWIAETADMNETKLTCQALASWLSKPKHNSLMGRGTPKKDVWGDVTDRQYAAFLLQGLPGIGPETAGAIYDAFGRVPFRWDVTEQELLKVPGIGKGRARKIIEMFERPEET